MTPRPKRARTAHEEAKALWSEEKTGNVSMEGARQSGPKQKRTDYLTQFAAVSAWSQPCLLQDLELQ